MKESELHEAVIIILAGLDWDQLDQLNAFYDLEQIACSQNVHLNFEKFVEKLQQNGWQTQAHHLNFDEWSYKFID